MPALRPIQRETYSSDLMDVYAQMVHASQGFWRAPSIPQNLFIRGLSSVSGLQFTRSRLNSGTSNPVQPSKLR